MAMKNLAKLRRILLILALAIVVFISLGFMTIVTIFKINHELNWSNIFSQMDFVDLILSGPGLVFSGIVFYVLIGTTVSLVKSRKNVK